MAHIIEKYVNSLFRIHTEINPRWSEGLNDTDKISKLVEENIGEYQKEKNTAMKERFAGLTRAEDFCSHY